MAAYWQQYKLNFDPFMADQANDEPFLSARFEQQLDLLVHLSASEPKIQLVTGLTGIGKSTMMRLFLKQISNSAGICKVHGGATITPDILQDLLVRHLGFTLDESRPGHFKQSLTTKLKQMHEKEQHFYLLIDNAHKLPKASLSFLLELAKLQATGDRAIHIVLFGGPQLEAIIAELTSSFMGEQLTHTIRLEPFTNDEIKAYIANRLQLAGWTKENPLKEDELEKIIQASHGVASKVNYFAKQILQQKMQGGHGKTRSKSNSPAFPFKTVIAGLALLMIVLISAQLYSHFTSPRKNEAQITEQTLTLNPDATDVSMQEVVAPSVVQAVKPVALKPTPPRAAVQAPPVMATPARIAAAETIVPVSAKIDTAQPESVKPDTVKTDNEVQAPAMVDSDKAVRPTTIPVVALESAQAEQLAAPQPTPAATPAPKEVVAVTTSKKHATEKMQRTPAASGTYSKDEQKILATSAHAYALQLAGASSLKNLQRHFNATAIAGKVLYFHTVLNGKDWYVAIYGQYPSSNAARKAIQTLPSALQTNNPWPRSYGNMQAAIRLK